MTHVESELLRVANQSDLQQALESLGLVELDETFHLDHHANWRRGGAETFVLPFSVVTNSARTPLIFKACVVPAIGRSTDDIVRSWLDRRYALARVGVSVPRLFAQRDGVLLEDYVEHELRSVLSVDINDRLLEDLVNLAAAYSALGFVPIDGYSDLRTADGQAVVVDFGEDLGPPGIAVPGLATPLEQLMRTLKSWRIELGPDGEEKLSAVFQAKIDFLLKPDL